MIYLLSVAANVGDTDFGSSAAFNTGGIDNMLVNLPAAGATSALGFAVGKIGSWLLQSELSVMLTEGRGQDIANPKNNHI